MSRCYALLLVSLTVTAFVFAQATPSGPKIKVHGTAEDTDGKAVAGVKLEFQLRGDPNRQPTATAADGKYQLELAPGMYDILAHMPDPKLPPFSGVAWLSQPETVLNVRVPKAKPTEPVTEYDFLGEWRVTDEAGHPVGKASVLFEAQERAGKRTRFPVYIETNDGEKETDGKTETDPAGRLPLRIREVHLAPDRAMAIVATVEVPGYQPRVIHVYPALQFSETGHLYAAYPDEYQIALKKR